MTAHYYLISESLINKGTSAKVMTDQLESKIINLCVAYMDVGEGREQERKLCETQAIARLLLAFRALILIILNPNLIRPYLCRGS